MDCSIPPPPLASIAFLHVCLSERTGAPTYPSFVPCRCLWSSLATHVGCSWDRRGGRRGLGAGRGG